MIEIFEGRLGGGKTYSALLRIESHLSRGGHVYTNVEVFADKLVQRLANKGWRGVGPDQVHFIASEEIARFYEVVPIGQRDLPVLVVVDEAHIWLDQRAFNKRELDQLFFFLTQSRKQNTDIIFISQNKKNLDARISRLVQYVWTFRDMRKWRLPFFYVRWPFPHLVQTCWDYDGKTILLKKWLVWDAGVYSLYNTDAMLSDVARAGVVENKQIKRENLGVFWLKKNMRILILLCPIMIGLGLWKLWPIWQELHQKPHSVALAAPPSPNLLRSPVIHRERLVSEAGFWSIGKEVHTSPLETEGGDYEEGQVCPWHRQDRERPDGVYRGVGRGTRHRRRSERRAPHERGGRWRRDTSRQRLGNGGPVRRRPASVVSALWPLDARGTDLLQKGLSDFLLFVVKFGGRKRASLHALNEVIQKQLSGLSA